jgi:hypothetical protein
LAQKSTGTYPELELLAKVVGSLDALGGISGSTWGASLMSMRKLYQAVIIT